MLKSASAAGPVYGGEPALGAALEPDHPAVFAIARKHRNLVTNADDGRRGWDGRRRRPSCGGDLRGALFAARLGTEGGAPGGPALLVVDEPENYVALSEIQPWLVHVSKSVEEKDRQVILMSHHPEVIDYVAAEAALQMYRSRGGHAQIAPLAVDLDQGLRASEIVAMGREDAPVPLDASKDRG